MDERAGKLFQLIDQANTIALSGHIRPDGDCVGSCMGFYNFLKENYPEKETVLYLEKIAGSFDFLKNKDQVVFYEDYPEDASVYDLFISLDCGSPDRLGKAEPIFQKAVHQVVIDHHISNTNFGELNIVRPEASSTCEVLFFLLEERCKQSGADDGISLSCKVSRDTAEALYLGIVHDTGVFRHSCTGVSTMDAARDLIEKGIPFTKIIEDSYYAKTYLQNQILGRCLLESFLMLKGKVIASCLDQKTMNFYGAEPYDLDGIVDQLRSTKGVEVAVFVYETGFHEHKISMRSSDKVDVSKIAVYFGGGGHKKAAGCTMYGTYQDVLSNLAGHIEAQLKAGDSNGRNS